MHKSEPGNQFWAGGASEFQKHSTAEHQAPEAGGMLYDWIVKVLAYATKSGPLDERLFLRKEE